MQDSVIQQCRDVSEPADSDFVFQICQT